MKKYLLAISVLAFAFSCSNDSQNSNADQNESGDTYQPENKTTDHPELNDEAENKRGIGKFTHVDLPATLDVPLATAGKTVFELKCYSCHKLTDERLVGPGWKGVTTRRAPEWIMNFATNTDEMLNKDAAAQAMLETCLIRMPNQNLNDDDARKVLEFMRQNDGVK
ncbi:MAG: cytochrome c [Chitinophagaceae bacterium]|nr:cytochrome c [Chitinophagaceae bacterium]